MCHFSSGAQSFWPFLLKLEWLERAYNFMRWKKYESPFLPGESWAWWGNECALTEGHTAHSFTLVIASTLFFLLPFVCITHNVFWCQLKHLLACIPPQQLMYGRPAWHVHFYKLIICQHVIFSEVSRWEKHICGVPITVACLCAVVWHLAFPTMDVIVCTWDEQSCWLTVNKRLWHAC